MYDGNTFWQTYDMIREDYGDKAVDQAAVYKWFRHFEEGQQLLEDDPQKGEPVVTHNKETIACAQEGNRQTIDSLWNCWWLQEGNHCKCPHLWESGIWLLHHKTH